MFYSDALEGLVSRFEKDGLPKQLIQRFRCDFERRVLAGEDEDSVIQDLSERAMRALHHRLVVENPECALVSDLNNFYLLLPGMRLDPYPESIIEAVDEAIEELDFDLPGYLELLRSYLSANAEVSAVLNDSEASDELAAARCAAASELRKRLDALCLPVYKYIRLHNSTIEHSDLTL